MIIRCERCSTRYELDEGLLSPQGSPVQCTRCQHVFAAYPSRPAAEAPPSPTSPSLPAGHSAGEEAGAARGARAGGPAVYRPPPAAAAAAAAHVQRAPILKRDAVGAFESRLRWSHRMRWLRPGAAAAAVVATVALVLLLRARGGPGDEELRLRSEAMALVAQDDVGSLERAEATLERLAASEPELRAALADAALARALRASSQDEEAGALSSRALADRAREDLRKVEAEIGPDPAVRRARAVAAALAGDREDAARAARSLRNDGGYDRWAELAEAILETEEDGPARTRGLARLQALVAKSPELIRARLLLARAQADSGRRQEALATLEALLAANPRHERARRLREFLSAPVPQAEAVAAPPVSPPPPGKASGAPAPAAPRPVSAAAPAPSTASAVPATGEPAPAGEAQVTPSQPTAPVPPAPLPVVVPPRPGPSAPSVPEEPGAGGDAQRPKPSKRPPAPSHLWPEPAGG
ncbi:MAG TPA: zinc-ribbon domain-containing protein [Anaeromyxobacteraceae bacterium]|nr:zinc-ribbon domain-containing protein [Anaeromyxobacteraceae bacterium]